MCVSNNTNTPSKDIMYIHISNTLVLARGVCMCVSCGVRMYVCVRMFCVFTRII